jgi:hypothetical protein
MYDECEISPVRKNPERIMSRLLEQAIEAIRQLSEAEQEVVATPLPAELAVEDTFDRAVSGSAHELAGLASEALAEYRAGTTDELDPSDLGQVDAAGSQSA